MIWRFQIYNLFREKFKFRDFTKAFTNFAKYIIAFIFAKFKYWRFSLRSTEVKEVSDETGETFKCCRGRLNWNKFQYWIKKKFAIVHINVPPADAHRKDWANIIDILIWRLDCRHHAKMNGGRAHQMHTCTVRVINNSAALWRSKCWLKMLTLKKWSLVKFFQYIPEYFRCPAIARGPPINTQFCRIKGCGGAGCPPPHHQ